MPRRPHPVPSTRPRLEALEERVTPGFASPTYYPTPTGAWAIASADLDGNGSPDLAATITQGVGPLLNAGGGSFRDYTSYHTSGFPDWVAAADLTGDNRPELIASDASSQRVSVLRNNGDGTFQPPVQSGLTFSAQGLGVADFDHDSRADVVTGSNNGLAVLLGNGDGTFRAPVFCDSGTLCQDLATGDFNGDGWLDVVTANYNPGQNLTLFLNSRDGTFTQSGFLDPGRFGGPYDVATGDFNGDGKTDIAAALRDTGLVGVYLGNGDGTFGPLNTFNAGLSVVRLTAADFNNDGKPDVACVGISVGGSPTDFAVLLGNGDGTFQGYRTYPGAYDPTDVVAADFNGDGMPDVATTSSTGPGSVAVALNTFPPHPAARLDITAPFPVKAGAAFAVTVTARYASGAPVPGYAGSVHFASSDPQAVLPADYTFTPSDGGSHTFAVTLNSAGRRAVTATDTDSTTVTGGATVAVTAYTVSGRTLTVQGTPGDNTFVFRAGPGGSFALDGATYPIDPAQIDTVVYQGNGGTDAASLVASGTGNVAALGPGSGQLRGPGYTATAYGVAGLYAYGGPTDQAYLFDSAAADTFVATSAYAYLQGGGFLSQANGFGYDRADSSAGGADAAYLYDSPGDDTLVAAPTYASLQGGGHTTLAAGFKQARAFGSTGNDIAYLNDSAGNDVLVGTPAYSYLQGSGYLDVANSFKQVRAYASSGNDTAYLYDSAGDDTLISTPAYSYLQGSGYLNVANAFRTVRAYASAGADAAYLYDSAGDDVLIATPAYSYLQGSGYLNVASGFRSVRAYASAGNDQAYLYDSAGADYFFGGSAFSYLQGAGYLNAASGFKRASAYSSGGADQAYLAGTGTAADTDVNLGVYSYLFGAGFLVLESGFPGLTVNPYAKRG
jgi:hypothetical protein